MAEPEDREPLAKAKEASNSLSVSNISTTAYADNMIIEHSCRSSSGETEFLDIVAVSPTVSSPPEAGKGKERSDSLVNDTQPAEKVSESTIAESNVEPSSAKRYAQPTYGPSAYFRCTFFNFNPHIVDLNRIGITYEYGDHYFVVVELPHPQTSQPIFQCGFLNRQYVGSYLVYEWESLVKEQIGKWGIAVCDDDKRWAIHSGMLQYMRFLCGQVAKALEHQILLSAQKRGMKLDVEKVKVQLSERFMTVLERVDMDVKTKEKAAAKEADKFMEEFMMFEE